MKRNSRLSQFINQVSFQLLMKAYAKVCKRNWKWTSLSQCASFFSPLRASGSLLSNPAQKCQMYYTVKNCNVNTALCHEAGWSITYLRRGMRDLEKKRDKSPLCSEHSSGLVVFWLCSQDLEVRKPRWINTLDGKKDCFGMPQGVASLIILAYKMLNRMGGKGLIESCLHSSILKALWVTWSYYDLLFCCELNWRWG